MKPLISFIICTYNSPKLIRRCFDSIIKQKYSEKEIIFVDGGSDKKTLNLLGSYKKRFKNIKVLHNKEKLPEGYGKGKWLGWKKARGRFVAIVDQDNELQERDWIIEMLKPFKKENIFGCACRVLVNPDDSLTNKYVALMGTDPFFAYRSLDGIINFKKIGEDKRDYFLIKINRDNIILTGGNCFVYRKSYIDKVGGYVQDTENIVKLVKKGYNKIAIPKNIYTHHLTTSGFFDFLKKKKKWAIVYAKKEKSGFSYIPKTKIERRELIINLFYTFIIIPNMIVAIRKFIVTRERAWLLHPVLTFITGFIYFLFSFIKC